MDKKPNQSFSNIYSSQIELNNINNNSGIIQQTLKKIKTIKNLLEKKLNSLIIIYIQISLVLHISIKIHFLFMI